MKPTTRSFYEQAAQRAIETIVNHLDEAVDLDALAKAACLSRYHFHRVFRGLVGETPLELSRRLRLERAARSLVETEGAITTIAFDASYETHEAFTRAFHAAYACAPSDFRRLAREASSACSPFPKSQLATPNGIHFGLPATSFIPLTATGASFMDATIKEMPAYRLAAVRHVGPYNQISEAFARLCDIAGPAGLIGRGDCLMLAVYHDDPEGTPAAELRSDAALTLPEGAPLPKGATELRVPAGRYASTMHKGPYDTLGDTWSRLMGQWIPSNGHRIAGSDSYEIYRNNPMEVPKEELLTELFVPLV